MAETAAAAAAHWEMLARIEDDEAEYLAAQGLFAGCQRNRAALYRRTVKALELEASTGKAHCSTCFGDHPNHQCQQARRT